MYEKIKIANKKIKTENFKTVQVREKKFNDFSSPLDQILFLQKTIGNQAVSGLIQKKLKIGNPDDRYEKEADQVAEKIMRMPDSTCPSCGEKESSPFIQTQEAEEKEEEVIQTKPLFEEITPVIQRQAEEEEENITGVKTAEEIERELYTLKGMGQPLSLSVRKFFEPRFGVDFSNVRIHADGESARMARALNAEAFTYGRDIYFAGGRYRPETTEGKKLLAHELTHVVQQKYKSIGIYCYPWGALNEWMTHKGRSPVKRQNSLGNSFDNNFKGFCGPDITEWLIDQMNKNQNHPVIKTGRKYRWPRWIPFFNIGWTAAALWDFEKLVKPGGPWDFKRTQKWWRSSEGKRCPTKNCDRTVTLCGKCVNYDVPGNIHYGWVGTRMGLRAWLLRFAPGIVQERGAFSDDPKDRIAIDIGIAMAEQGRGLCNEVKSKYESLNLDNTQGCLPCKSQIYYKNILKTCITDEYAKILTTEELKTGINLIEKELKKTPKQCGYGFEYFETEELYKTKEILEKELERRKISEIYEQIKSQIQVLENNWKKRLKAELSSTWGNNIEDWLLDVIGHFVGLPYKSAHSLYGVGKWRKTYQKSGVYPAAVVCDQLGELIQKMARGIKYEPPGLTGHYRFYQKNDPEFPAFPEINDNRYAPGATLFKLSSFSWDFNEQAKKKYPGLFDRGVPKKEIDWAEIRNLRIKIFDIDRIEKIFKKGNKERIKKIINDRIKKRTRRYPIWAQELKNLLTKINKSNDINKIWNEFKEKIYNNVAKAYSQVFEHNQKIAHEYTVGAVAGPNILFIDTWGPHGKGTMQLRPGTIQKEKNRGAKWGYVASSISIKKVPIIPPYSEIKLKIKGEYDTYTFDLLNKCPAPPPIVFKYVLKDILTPLKDIVFFQNLKIWIEFKSEIKRRATVITRILYWEKGKAEWKRPEGLKFL